MKSKSAWKFAIGIRLRDFNHGLVDFPGKVTSEGYFWIRFFNQDPVEVLKSKSAYKFEIKDCSKILNQGPVDPVTVFNHDHDRGEKNSIKA